MWKNCINCGEEIPAEAHKCRFCGAVQEEPKAETAAERSEKPEYPDKILLENIEELHRLEEERQAYEAEIKKAEEEAALLKAEEEETGEAASDDDSTGSLAFAKASPAQEGDPEFTERYEFRTKRREEARTIKQQKSRQLLRSIICVIAALLIVAGIAIFSGKSGKGEMKLPEESKIAEAPTVSPSAKPTTEPKPTESLPVSTPEQPQVQDVEGLEISIANPYTELPGVYSGKAIGGVPEGEGSYIVKDEKGETLLSYTGVFSGGKISGKGELSFENTVMSGSFENGLLNGNGALKLDEVLRYSGGFVNGKKSGEGKLYTQTRELIYEGSFSEDMIDETEDERNARGKKFADTCNKLSVTVYNRALHGNESAINQPIFVKGNVVLTEEQAEESRFVLYFNGDKKFPIVMQHVYSTDEAKVQKKDNISCYAVIVGKTKTVINGKKVECPLMELVYITRTK